MFPPFPRTRNEYINKSGVYGSLNDFGKIFPCGGPFRHFGIDLMTVTCFMRTKCPIQLN